MNFYSLLSIQNNFSMFIFPLSLLHSECCVYLKKLTSVSWLLIPVCYGWTSLAAQALKNLPAVQELSLIPGSGRSPGEGNGYLLQYSCLENSIDSGVWWATVHGVAKSRTRLSDQINNNIDIRTFGSWPLKSHGEQSWRRIKNDSAVLNLENWVSGVPSKDIF